jgi:CheY-like chemotaxis protein
MTAAQKPSNPIAGAAGPGSISRILVVEDDPLTRVHVMELLSELGYLACSAANSLEALKLVETDPSIALVFTDIRMPGLNGIVLADMLYQHRPKLKILYTTGGRGMSSFDTDGGILHGNILKKPYGVAELQAQIDRLLR